MIIETGEYSDRNWENPVRMLKNATKAELLAEFKRTWRKKKGDYGNKPNPDDFLPWLVKKGWVEDVPNVHGWHISHDSLML